MRRQILVMLIVAGLILAAAGGVVLAREGTNSVQTVQAASSTGSPWDYDTDQDGVISKAEAIAALADYFGLQLPKEQVIQVLVLAGIVSPPPQTVIVPAAPSGLTATAASTARVNLGWTDNSNNETGFRIERATNSIFTANLVTATVAANTISYADTSVVASTTYYFRVVAYNSAGDSTPSSTASASTPAPAPTPTPTPAVPQAPSGLTATAASTTRVNLGWTDNSNNETGFRIERATNNIFTANLVTVTAAANAVSYADTSVVASTAYYYRVLAYNSAGDSAPSSTASVSTPAPAPTPTPTPTFNVAQFYANNCARCHGANRDGGVIEVPLTPTSLSGFTVAQLASFIQSHRGVTSGEANALAEFLKNTPP